ncbi:MAG: hypothetical protein K6C98_05020 [Treponema sp.]|nr:hypothetical protein [Treponema sp.]
MTSGQKIALSTLLSMLIFAGFVIAANLRLFSELETRFYAQAKVGEKVTHLEDVAKGFDSYILNILKSADDYAKTPSVLSYMEQNPSEKSVIERRNRTEQLFKELPVLSGIRIVDKSGRNVHYSSFDKTDILKQTGITKVYKNYPDIQRDSGEVEFPLLKTEGTSKVLVDSRRNRLIISQPFYWYDNIQNGIILFYFNLYDIREHFVSAGVISYGEGFSIYADDALKGGVALGVPLNAQEDFKLPVLTAWKNKASFNTDSSKPSKIVSSSDGDYWAILSAPESKFLNISGIYRSSSFELSKDLILLIYICVFTTIFLLLYLLFSFSQDPMSVTRKKIKRLQAGIIQEYLERKQDVDWAKIAAALRFRKNDFIEDLKRDLSKKSKRNQKEVSELLDKSWEDVIAIFESQRASESRQPQIIEKTVVVQAPAVPEKVEPQPVVEPIFKTDPTPEEVVEDLEDVEEVDDLEDVEGLEDVEDVESVDDVEAVENIDEVEDIEDVVDSADSGDVEDVTELDEVEDVVDSADSSDVEDVAELDEVKDEDDVEDIKELDDVDEVSELEEVDDVEKTDDVDNLDEVEDIEELDDVENIDDVEELTEVEDIAEDENITEVEADEEVEDLEEVVETDNAEPYPLEPLEDLEEYDEYITEKDVPYEDEKTTFYNVENLFPGREEYFEDRDAFIRSERFANVNNLFAEEISLGDEYDAFKRKHPSSILNFKVYKISDMYNETEENRKEEDGVLAGSQELLENIAVVHGVDDIEELTEELPPAEGKPYFSMTAFAKDDDVEDLEEVVEQKEVIYEDNGVYQIAQNLDYSGAVFNPEFKTLVDSVLNKK